MASVIADVFPLAMGVALSPFPVMAVLMVLASPVAGVGGLGFLAGRVLGVAAVATVVAIGSEFVSVATGSSTAVSCLLVLLGIGLMTWAIVKWRGQLGGGAAEVPGWLASIDSLSTGGATRLGVILSVANPKELAFGVGAGLTIGAAGGAVGPTIAAVAVYTSLACLSVAAPVAGVVVAGDRAAGPVASAREWMVRNNAAVTSVVLLVIGAMVFSRGLADL